MNESRLVTLSFANKKDFLIELEKALCNKFNTTVENLPENYGGSVNWGLLSMIRNNEIDTYQLLYRNGAAYSGSGGVIRQYDNTKVYQGLFRGFSMAGMVTKHLQSSSITLTEMIPHQLSRAIGNDCKKLIFSYNDYNHRLYLLHKYVIGKKFSNLNPSTFTEMKLFNGVNQWMIECSLE